MRKINLNELEGLSGISQKVAQFYYEATVLSMKACGHQGSVRIKVFGAIEEKFELFWTAEIEGDAERSWKDEEELVEYGATGISLLLLSKLTGFTIFERSPKGTRADFWVGKINEQGEEELMGLLEVSGIKRETPENRINTRMNSRIKRMEHSPFREIPYYAIVVEFQSPKAKYYKNER